MSGFVKIFGSHLLNSSVWSHDAETKVVWITLLAMADANGIVSATIPGISRAAGVSLEKTEEAIELFEKPDPHSRTLSNAGRRLERVIVDDQSLIQLTNYKRYRAYQSPLQAAKAESMRKYRRNSKKLDVDTHRATQTTRSSAWLHVPREAEAEADTPRPSDSVVNTPPLILSQSGSSHPAPSPYSANSEDVTSKVNLRAGGRAGVRARPSANGDVDAVHGELVREYQARYEAATGIAWMSATAAWTNIDVVAKWVQRQATLSGDTHSAIVAALLDGAWAQPWMRERSCPWKFLAEDPARFLAPREALPESFGADDWIAITGQIPPRMGRSGWALQREGKTDSWYWLDPASGRREPAPELTWARIKPELDAIKAEQAGDNHGIR